MDRKDSLSEGSNAAQELLEAALERTEIQSSPIEFWRGFLHTLHDTLVVEMGETDFLDALRDALKIISIVVAQHRGETERH